LDSIELGSGHHDILDGYLLHLHSLGLSSVSIVLDGGEVGLVPHCHDSLLLLLFFLFGHVSLVHFELEIGESYFSFLLCSWVFYVIVISVVVQVFEIGGSCWGRFFYAPVNQSSDWQDDEEKHDCDANKERNHHLGGLSSVPSFFEDHLSEEEEERKGPEETEEGQHIRNESNHKPTHLIGQLVSVY
jgi:hypothetical protein